MFLFDDFSIKIDNVVYNDKKEGAKMLLTKITSFDEAKELVDIGEYRGFLIKGGFNGMTQEYYVNLCGKQTYNVEIGQDELGNITRLNNALSKIPTEVKRIKENIDNLYKQIEEGKEELKKPFDKEQELNEKSKRLNELNSILKLDEKTPEISATQEETEIQSTKIKKELCTMER